MPDRIKIIFPGDCHASPEYDNQRALWLGSLIVEERPTHIVLPGDTGDFPSLCGYEKKKARAEGKRLALDEAALVDFLEKVKEPVRDLNVKQAMARRRQYAPDWIIHGGNHDEERLWRVGDDHPEFSGLEETFKETCREYGFRYVDYRTIDDIGGFLFSHHFAAGYKAASSFAALKRIANGRSLVSGHCHSQKGLVTSSDPTGKKSHVLFAGEYCHLSYSAHWCKDTKEVWHSGVTILDGCKDGDFDSYTWISQQRMKELYG